MNDMAKNMLLWIIIAVVLMMVFRNFDVQSYSAEVDYSQFLADVKTGKVESVEFDGSTLSGKFSDGDNFITYSPETDNTSLIGVLEKNNVKKTQRVCTERMACHRSRQ